MLLLRPGTLGFYPVHFGFTLAYQTAHLLVAERLERFEVPRESVSRILSRSSEDAAKSVLITGAFLAACSFIPTAPRWIFLSLGLTSLTCGIAILLVISDLPSPEAARTPTARREGSTGS